MNAIPVIIMELAGKMVNMRHLHMKIGSNCMFCHSSFDQYKNQNVTKANATGVSCGVCHNIHDMTDNKYAADILGR